MSRAVEQIEQEIAALDQTVAAIAQALHNTYQQYLTALGKATRQQLILAGYHVCTHGYPEQFLDLSRNQRQELQQALQQLAKQGQTELLECLNPVTAADVISDQTIESDQDELEEIGPEQEDFESNQFQADQLAENDPQAIEAQQTQFSPVAPLASEDGQPQVEPPDQQSEPEPDPQQNDEISEEIAKSPAVFDPTKQAGIILARFDQPLHPKDIARWQAIVEDRINEILQTLSHATNRLLQQADILPSRLPEPVLEVAAKADLSSETAASPPNLLNLLIEAESEDDDKPSMTQVIAVRLRLSEIEFSDAATAAVRSKLRHLMGQLAKLGREYQRKQKERAVAQAESAWRASWFESEP
jgi:hypothetical protein